MAKSSETRPRSFAALASGRVFWCKVTSWVSSTLSRMAGVERPEPCASARGTKNDPRHAATDRQIFAVLNTIDSLPNFQLWGRATRPEFRTWWISARRTMLVNGRKLEFRWNLYGTAYC